MIDFIFGEIADIYDDVVVVLNNNIGYRIRMPIRDIDLLTIGESVKIFTRMVVREDDISLYGFDQKDTRILFDLLTTVSGIGPKVGLGILSSLSNGEIRTAIISEDKTNLVKAPGVGKKTGDRIILELKDKISKYEFDSPIEVEEIVPKKEIGDDPAIEALVSLGYNKYEAVKALDIVDGNLDISARIKEALKQLGRL